MSKRGPDSRSGIDHEPHLMGRRLQADPSERTAGDVLRRQARSRRDSDQLDHSVWDEPALSAALAGRKASGPTDYAHWLEQRRVQTSSAWSWLISFAAALCAGPWAVIGVMSTVFAPSVFQVLAIVVVGPVAEEVMKGAVPLYIVERRPYLFRSRLQIAICALASGGIFATLENLLYLHVYVPEPTPLLVQWRWTVCVALHAGCALVYSLGLMRIWIDVWRRQCRPRLELGVAHAFTAAVIHGAYNGLMVLLSMTRFRF